MDRSELPSLEQLERERRRIRKRQRRRSRFRSVLGTTLVLLALAVLVSVYFLPVLVVQGASMEPTLREGQAVACVRGSRFQRGDIVAFHYGSKTLIKRVIAGEGDTLDIDEQGRVCRNGVWLSEDYVKNSAPGKLSMELPCTVPEDCWFLMGDNREVSVDSRSAVLGFVSSEQIIGRVSLRLWPLWYWERFYTDKT